MGGVHLLAPELRIIGSFVRLYAQQVSKIVEFTTDCFHQDTGGAYFRFGRNPVLLPPKLARLIERQIAQPAVSSAVSPHSTGPAFLFPGHQLGAHAVPAAPRRSCGHTICRPWPRATPQ